MKAVRHLGHGAYELVDVPHPGPPAPNEAIIEVTRSGICGTDLKVLSDPPGLTAKPGVILGHEIVGLVREVGSDVKRVARGDRVAVNPDQGCGACFHCQLGQPMRCESPLGMGLMTDGGFSERVRAPAHALYALPDHLSWCEASLIEPLSCVLESLKRGPWSTIRSAAVLGAGPMGLLAVTVLSDRGVAPLLATEPRATRRTIAKRCGATHAVDPSTMEGKAWRELTGTDGGPDLVVDAVGHLLPTAMSLVAPRGTIIQLGYNETVEVQLTPGILNAKALQILSSDGNEFMFPSAIDLAASGRLPLAQIVTCELPITSFDEALERMRDGAEAKVVLTFK